VIAKPEERLSVRSQITLLDEAAIALKDHSIGFTLARDFDPRELGLHALKGLLSRITNEPSCRRLSARRPAGGSGSTLYA
jgi:hypothetical protein